MSEKVSDNGAASNRLAVVMDLIGDYWDLAVAEGEEARSTDTVDGDAQRVLSAIIAELAALQADAREKGAVAADAAWQGEVARLLPHYRSSTGTDQARRQMLEHFAAFGAARERVRAEAGEAAETTVRASTP